MRAVTPVGRVALVTLAFALAGACAPATASERGEATPFRTAPLVRQIITPSPTAAGSRSPEVLSGRITIEMGDEFFLPMNVTIRPGTTVTWVNRGQDAHTASARDGSFASPTLNFGESYSYTFTNPGRYPYFCLFHGDMFGEVTVARP